MKLPRCTSNFGRSQSCLNYTIGLLAYRPIGTKTDRRPDKFTKQNEAENIQHERNNRLLYKGKLTSVKNPEKAADYNNL